MIRLLPALVVLALAVAATWFLARRPPEPLPAPPTPEATASPTVRDSPTAPRAAASPDPSYRLAGTVVGDRLYAIIEAPDGRNELYAIDSEVPGIGKLIAIGPNSATFEGRDGQFEMGLVPAAAPTPRPPREDGAEGEVDADLDDETFEDDEYLDEEREYYDDER